VTRQEFIDDITTMSALLDFCYEEDCSVCEDVYSEEAMDDYINENCLVDWARSNSWYGLRDMLNDLPTGYDWYYVNEYGDFEGVDDYVLEDFKDRVLEWAEDNDVFDQEEEEDEPEDDGDEAEALPEEPEEPEEGLDPEFPIADLFASSITVIRTMADHALAQQQEKQRLEAEREAEQKRLELAEEQETKALFQQLFEYA